MDITHTSDASFEADVLKADGLVLVDYWAEWCGPCKMLAPMLDEVATDYEGKVRVVKLNIDDNPEVTQRSGIRGIPTLKLFRNGEEVATQVGMVPKAKLTQFLDSNL